MILHIQIMFYFLILFFQFCVFLKEWSSRRMFNQIWWYLRYENRKSQVHFHIVGDCGNFWWLFPLKNNEFVSKYSFFKPFFCLGEMEKRTIFGVWKEQYFNDILLLLFSWFWKVATKIKIIDLKATLIKNTTKY